MPPPGQSWFDAHDAVQIVGTCVAGDSHVVDEGQESAGVHCA